jgi:hypothetical protein
MITRAVLLSAALMGCDPGYSVTGHVTEADGGGVSGVLVSLECGGREMLSGKRIARSVDGGSFLLMGVGCVPDDCRLVFRDILGTGSMRLQCQWRSFMCGQKSCNQATVEFRFASTAL